MALPEINRARIEALETEVNSLQGDFDSYDPVVRDESFENVTPLAPQNVRATALFRVIQVMWTYDTATYVSSYEVYASKNAGFTPTVNDLIWSGKAGAYGHPASLGETWYFRVRARNTHGVYSAYSEEVSAATVSIDGLEIDEQWQLDTVQYANQYTDARELEIMTTVADKLDATVYHGQIVLKADTATVNEQFDVIRADVLTKAGLTYVDNQLALKEKLIHKDTVAPTDLSLLWLDTTAVPNVLKRHNGTTWVKATPTVAGEVGAYTIAQTDTALNGKVATTTYELDKSTTNTRITNAESDISQNASDIALKVAKTTYDADITAPSTGLIARMTSAEAGISINADEIALRATKTEFDAVANRVSTAESSITTNANEITLRATKTEVNALSDRVGTAESSITTNANQIALRVTKTEYDTDINDAANGLIARMTSAESSITANAGEISLKASQSELDTRMGTVVSRLDTAEAEILIQSGEISQRVTTTTYNDGMSGKEATHYKQNTAPPHAVNRMWLDTSVVPNQWKRSTGSAWVKSSPTTAAEVGAYSTSQGSTLANRVTTAEGSITTQAGQISLKAEQSSLDTTNQRLTTAEAAITVNADGITSKVSKDGVISSINQSAEQIKIDVAKLTLNGDFEVVGGLTKLKDLVVDKVHIKDGAIIERMVSAQVIANVINAGSAYIDFAHINNVTITNAMISALDAGKINTGLLDASRVRIGASSSFDADFALLKANSVRTTNLASGTAGKWYRIAMNTGNRAYAKFILKDITSSQHGIAVFEVSTNYGQVGEIPVHNYAFFSTRSFTQVRVVKASTYDPVYVEVFIENNARTQSLACFITDNIQDSGWVPLNWEVAPAVPSGYVTINKQLNTLSITSATADRAESLAAEAFTLAEDSDAFMQNIKYLNTVYIDGSKIFAKSVTADQIQVNSLESLTGTFASGANGKVEMFAGRILTSDYGGTYGSVLLDNGLSFVGGNLYASSDTLGYVGLNSLGHMEITTQLYTDLYVKRTNGTLSNIYAGEVDVTRVDTSYIDGAYGLSIQLSDSWLRLNSLGNHTSGIYTGSSLVRTDSEFQVGSSGSGYRITGNGRPTTGQTEQGYFGTGGAGNPASSNTAFSGVNFRTRKTYTPSSISYTSMSTNLAPKFTDITADGFLVYLTTSGNTGNYYYHRGLYTA